MGTRTVIRFIKKNYTSKKQLYIPCDGYLEFVGKKLFEMMQEYNKKKANNTTDDIINMCKNVFDECNHTYEVESTKIWYTDLEYTYTVIVDSKNNMEIDVGFVYGKSDETFTDDEYSKYYEEKPDKKFSKGHFTD